MSTDAANRPSAVPWPPILFAGAIAAALLLARMFPLAWPGLDDTGAQVVGYAFGLAGLALTCWGLVTLYRARTNILPHKGADRLVTEGAFRFRRNPIYMGEALILLGLAQVTLNIWFGDHGADLRTCYSAARDSSRGAPSGGALRRGVSGLQGPHAALVLKSGWPWRETNARKSRSSWRTCRPARAAASRTGWPPSPRRASPTRTRPSTGCAARASRLRAHPGWSASTATAAVRSTSTRRRASPSVAEPAPVAPAKPVRKVEAKVEVQKPLGTRRGGPLRQAAGGRQGLSPALSHARSRDAQGVARPA